MRAGGDSTRWGTGSPPTLSECCRLVHHVIAVAGLSGAGRALALCVLLPRRWLHCLQMTRTLSCVSVPPRLCGMM